MLREDLKNYELPDSPGVYVFRDARRRILYIGKATSLRDRTRSYFASDIAKSRGARIEHMVAEAKHLTWEETNSVLEALILEAALIKKHQPPYNVDEKDNKSFNYLVITKETFPRVLMVRGRELFGTWDEKNIKYVFGPFPHGGQLKEALKLVRKIFPFRDSCVPDNGRPCFNRQIGLCPGVCDGSMDAHVYSERIHDIAQLFSGKKKSLLVDLNRRMQSLAKSEQFERAADVRRQIGALTHIRDVALIKADDMPSTGGEQRRVRFEAYDVAHTSGTNTVGVTVVREDGEFQKTAYRTFTMRGVRNDDIAALTQLLERRLGHPEWQLPSVFVFDGGRTQLTIARSILKNAGLTIPAVSVVKDERHKPKDILGDEPWRSRFARDILLANAEAHRFAVATHRKKREKIR
jgi:excinuclease UvrABC nuclease subunit